MGWREVVLRILRFLICYDLALRVLRDLLTIARVTVRIGLISFVIANVDTGT